MLTAKDGKARRAACATACGDARATGDVDAGQRRAAGHAAGRPTTDAGRAEDATPAAREESRRPPGGAGHQGRGGGRCFLQVGLYSSKENAETHVQQLKAQGFTAFVLESTGPGPRFRVRMGPYADKAEADRQVARLTAAGQKPFITR